MEVKCEQFKDELVSLVYPDEPKSSELEAHLKSCSSCQIDLGEMQQVISFFQKLPDPLPPAHLTEKVFSRIAPQGLLEKIKHLFLHPAYVGLTVFCLTLAGSILYQRYIIKPTYDQLTDRRGAVISAPVTSTASVNSEAPMAQPVAYQSNFRMVGWQPTQRFIEDLDRPVLRHTDLVSLEQASIEAVASFKHQLAMRHMLDGEYEKAHVVLESITDHYLNYTHWEQAVLQHMRLMKKMGRDDDMKHDLARLREYAMATPAVVQQAEMEANY